MEVDRKALEETFLAESMENLAAMEEGLLALETRPGDAELLHTVFRAAHTLKGNASSFNLERVAGLAHAAEDLLDRLRSGGLETSSPLVTLLLQGVDALKEMLPGALAGREEIAPDHTAVLSRLRSFGRRPAGRRKKEEVPPPPDPASRTAERRRSEGRRLSDVLATDIRGRTLRVGIEKLDRLLNLSGELMIARGRLRQILEEGTTPQLRHALEAHLEADRLYADLQDLLMEVRMVSVGPLFRQHKRTVRDQAAALGKQARLVLEDEGVEVDTKIIEHIHDPLTHMIRNALDHGIEPPAVRESAGKDPCGTVTLRARHEAGSVRFEVSDDGVGLRRDRILAGARARGLVTGQETLTDGLVHRLIFEPGFSTTEDVTELSGRGVGLDVVRRNVEALRGTLSVESREGSGTTITVRVPLTLAIISGFGVGVGEETYVIPLEAVVETLALRPEEGHHVDGRGVINLRGAPLPYVHLRKAFGQAHSAAAQALIVVVQHEGMRAGLAVDALLGESQTVIKPLGRLFQALPGVTGSTILGNGRVALILDVGALLHEATEDGVDVEASGPMAVQR